MSAILVLLLLAQDGLRPLPLESKVAHVQPMTGIVLWAGGGAPDRRA